MELAPEQQAERGSRGALKLRGPLIPTVIVIALLAIVAILLAILVVKPGGTTTAATPTVTPTPTATPPTVSQIFQKVGPSVVVIESGNSLGTGVVAADDGTILTADHVVAGGSAITVTFSDGSKSEATVASTDPKQDIATLTPAKLPQILVPATLGGSAAVGASVVAIGNPLGLAYSVSSGIVSGLDREADTDNGDFSGLIQFDASVNPGSSGGPLLDAAGNVMGIVVSIADPGHDDSWSGIGFAVPIGAALGSTGKGDQLPL
jgi:S1-C subfamily serine protease